jgi:hypothetical protein
MRNMNLDLRQQRVFDGVELVGGTGAPNLGQMCIMSFVACLAGEGHTDCPTCASPLIRAFAIPLNDGMPREVRQRLKSFAPRIIGTNDGFDAARAELLAHTLAEEILPKAAAQYLTLPQAAPGRAGLLRHLWMWVRRDELQHRITRLLEQVGSRQSVGHEADLASGAARLVILCARNAPSAQEAEWYWARAIGLLDKLCDIGAFERRPSEMRPDRLEWLERILEERERAAAAAPSDAFLWVMLPFSAKSGTDT